MTTCIGATGGGRTRPLWGINRERKVERGEKIKVNEKSKEIYYNLTDQWEEKEWEGWYSERKWYNLEKAHRKCHEHSQ